MAPEDNDGIAKTFAVKEDMSSIYLYINEAFGGAVKMNVSFDGMVAGQAGHKIYFYWEVDPETHQISSIGENTSTISLDTGPGKPYFIWQEIKMGVWTPRSRLQQVPEEVGRKGVLECKRALSNFSLINFPTWVVKKHHVFLYSVVD